LQQKARRLAGFFVCAAPAMQTLRNANPSEKKPAKRRV
jgi:hypothetical protein